MHSHTLPPLLHSAAAAYERMAAAITIAEELQLGAPNKLEMLPLATALPALRHVRFVYFNPVDGSLKVGKSVVVLLL